MSNMGASRTYDTGFYPSLTSQAGIGLVEVHQGQANAGPLWYRLATWTGQSTGTGYGLRWSNSVKFEDNGFHPSVASGEDAYGAADPFVVEVHQGGSTFGPLWFRTGKYSGTSIAWSGSAQYDNGENPSVAYYVAQAGQPGLIVEVHQGGDGFGPLWSKTGTVNANGTIAWANGESYDNGENPAIAVCGTQLIEVHQGQHGAGPLWYRTAQITASGITWNSPGAVYDSNGGTNPTIACDSYTHQGIEMHQAAAGAGALWARPFVFN
jgi:hypothetical protein